MASVTAPFLTPSQSGRVSILLALVVLLGLPIAGSLLTRIGWSIGRGLGPLKTTPKPPLRWGFWSLVGIDKRVSTSKTVAIAWTYSLAAALLAIVIASLLGHGEALGKLRTEGLQAGYAVLIGGPLGAAILAKGIVSTQLDSG